MNSHPDVCHRLTRIAPKPTHNQPCLLPPPALPPPARPRAGRTGRPRPSPSFPSSLALAPPPTPPPVQIRRRLRSGRHVEPDWVPIPRFTVHFPPYEYKLLPLEEAQKREEIVHRMFPADA
ncbi:hypothetical protein BN946_scf185006.g15 [Trametes cinnabarina]|uniref:Uncharacterized protein n=1 Tax=Pycnoporus cinnabarinus TaxID=5643 RepID=A0A060SWQ6_PYCCI|nr:hypothetical protein BN946_scf185006.g15 [Trametes cinnabarina]